MSPFITRAEKRNLGALARIENECFTNPWSPSQLLYEITSGESLVLVAAEEEEALGFLIFRPLGEEGEIFNVAVSGSARRRGIGGALLQAAIQEAQRAQVENIFLEVRAGNAPAIALYQKYGFEKAGLRKKYYDNPTEDAVVMVRRSKTGGNKEYAHTIH